MFHYDDSLSALSSSARGSGPPSFLTTELRAHLSKLVEEYHGLQGKTETVLSGDQHQKLYQQIASLEPVVKMVRHLEAKEQVWHM